MLVFHPSPSILPSVPMCQARCPPQQRPSRAVTAWGEKKLQSLSQGASGISLRFLKCLCPLEEIYDVIVFEDFHPSDVCPKAHTWFLRFLDKPGCLASSPFPVACSPAHLSSLGQGASETRGLLLDLKFSLQTLFFSLHAENFERSWNNAWSSQ